MAKQDLAGRHALVTGAASGIGRATAFELARRGAVLSLLDVAKDGVSDVARRIIEDGGQAAAHVADVSDAGAIDALVGELPPVDFLVSNAGVAVVAPFVETKREDWDWIAGINLWGPLHLVRRLLPGMIARQRGHLAFVASLSGLVGAPGMVAYTTTKFALVGFAEALRYELAGTGVGVTSICPGYVRTNLHKATRYANKGFRHFLDRAPSWYGLTDASVARSIADGIERSTPLLVLGPEKLGWWLKRLAPETAFRVTHWVAKRVGTVGKH